MAVLQLRFFGQFEVTRDQQRITAFESDKGRALLAYLAVESAQAHSRSALTALLWPDFQENSARGNLRQALYQLRQTLGDETQTQPLLLVTRQTLQCNPDASYQCDVTTFSDLLQRCASHPHTELGQCTVCLTQLRQAVERYRGEFLTGFTIADSAPFEEWRRIKQEHFHLQALDALMILADAHEATGAHEEALDFARRQLLLEPWRERTHCQIMRLLARQGQRAAATAQYHTCHQVLLAELGIEPAAATVALYEQIRNGLLTENTVTNISMAASPTPTSVVLPPVPNGQPTTQEYRAPTFLPEPITPFVGREEELADIITILQDKEVRLLTLAGAGGMGKTRLALQGAQHVDAQHTRFPDGIWFVTLAPLLSVSDIVPTIAATLGLNLVGLNPHQALFTFLQDKQLLLILDNFEHLLEGAGLVAELLQRASKLRVLVTSRVRLQLQGESLFTVHGMDYDTAEDLAAAAKSSAVRLFVQGARRVQLGFRLMETNYRDILAICRVVQGMPLALELAAAWSEHLAPAEIHAEIQQNLDFLTADWLDTAERQRSVRAVFAWSWQMLGETEQQAFRQLAVFRGGFTRDAASAVAMLSLRTLSALVEKSLLTVTTLSRRYELHELLRQFAAEQLATVPQTRDLTEARHSAYYLTYIADHERRLVRNESRKAIGDIQAELDNIRQAWQQATQQGNLQLLDKSVVALWYFYELTGLNNESGQALDQAIATLENGASTTVPPTTPPHTHQQLLSKLLALRARVAMKQGHFDVGMELAWRAFRLGAAWGGMEGEVQGALVVGQGFSRKGLYGEAHTYLNQVLHLVERHQQHKATLELLSDAESTAYLWLGALESEKGNFAAGKAHLNAAIRQCQVLNKIRWETQARINVANLLRRMGEYAAARQIYEECLPIMRTQGYPWGELEAMVELADTVEMLGEYNLANDLFHQAEGQLGKFGYRVEQTHCQLLMARFYCCLGAYGQARHWLLQAFHNQQLEEMPWLHAMGLLVRATLQHLCGTYDLALADAQTAAHIAEGLHNPLVQANSHLLLGHIQLTTEEVATARHHYGQAHVLYQQLGNRGAAAEANAGVALTEVIVGECSHALARVAALLPQLQAGQTIGVHQPFFPYLACYQVLTACHDQRAATVLAHARAHLQRYADQIHDVALRRAFLEQVPIHQALAGINGNVLGLRSV